MNRKLLSTVVVTVAFFLSGCASYSGSTLRSLADRNLAASEVTAEMCRDFATASQAAITGDDKAWPFLGKAVELKGLSVGLSKHSIQCFSAVERLNREANPMSDFNHGSLLQIFKRSWGNSKVLAGNAD